MVLWYVRRNYHASQGKLHDSRLHVQVYFDKVPGMENHVLLSPQWTIDSITYVVRDIQLHRFRRDRKAMELEQGKTWTDLMQHGILAAPLLDYLWIDRREHGDFLLKLMCKLGLFAQLPTVSDDGKLRYFVPSAVSSAIPRGMDSTHSAADVQRHLRLEDSSKPHECILDFNGFLPNGFFERVVNRLVSDFPAGYQSTDPRILWNAAELCMGDPEMRLVLIVGKDRHTIQAVMADKRACSIIPHIEDVAKTVSSDFYFGRICFEFRGVLPPRTFRRQPSAVQVAAAAESGLETTITSNADFVELRAFFEMCNLSRTYAEMYAKTGLKSDNENTAETLGRHYSACVQVNIETDFYDHLQESFGVEKKMHRTFIVAQLKRMPLPQAPEDFLLGYYGGELVHVEHERKQIQSALHPKLLATLQPLGSVAELHRGLQGCKYRVLHLAMDGHLSTPAGKHTLAFTDKQPQEPDVVAHAIADGCKHDGGKVRGSIECVFINACFGADIGEGLKREEHQVPWVISWTTMVDDEAAQAFAEEFYMTLSKSPSSFLNAFERAKTSLRLRHWVIDEDGGDPDSESPLLERQKRENNLMLKAAGIPKLHAPKSESGDLAFWQLLSPASSSGASSSTGQPTRAAPAISATLKRAAEDTDKGDSRGRAVPKEMLDDDRFGDAPNAGGCAADKTVSGVQLLGAGVAEPTPVLISAPKVLLPLKWWHLFISHKQQGADGYAVLVKERLGRRGYKCWVDTAERCDKEGMETGIKGSEAVLLILFKGTLDRPYCRFEMRLARAYSVPVIVILEPDSYRDTYVSILDVLKQFDSGALPADLKCVAETADFNFFYRRQAHEVDAMLTYLCEKLDKSKAGGTWPLNSESKSEESITGEVSEAYRLLHEELRICA